MQRTLVTAPEWAGRAVVGGRVAGCSGERGSFSRTLAIDARRRRTRSERNVTNGLTGLDGVEAGRAIEWDLVPAEQPIRPLQVDVHQHADR